MGAVGESDGDNEKGREWVLKGRQEEHLTDRWGDLRPQMKVTHPKI